MSARYVAAVWDEPGSPELRARLIARFDGWRVALDTPKLTVLVHSPSNVDCDIYRLDDGSGLVLGTLFEGSFGALTLGRIKATAGACLLERFWGSYVAFLSLEKAVVLRDPSGQQQCYYTKVRGATFFFSRLADFEGPIHVNWRYVRWRLAFGAMPCRPTGIQSVDQLMPGEAFIGSAGTRFYWNVQSIAGDVVESHEIARDLLYSATRACIHAWASLHPKILLLLSGGLDSAIVLACLRDAPSRPEIFALNNYSAGSDSDERRYAQLAAEQANVSLIELERDPDASWEPILRVRRTPVPYATIGTWQNFEQMSHVAAVTGARVQYSGGGGDVLFYRHGGAAAAADYLRGHVNLAEMRRHLLSAAYRDRKSVWRLLGHAVRYGALRGRYPMLPDPRIVRPLLGQEMRGLELPGEADLHPLMTTLRGMPSGKQHQLSCMVAATCSHESPLDPGKHAVEIAPLLSQPLMEAVLRIPLYRLSYDGRDRALARDAFSGQIPQAIERRQSKGGIEEYAKRSLLNNMKLIKELLLEGSLVSEGLLDKDKLWEILTQQPSEIPSRVAELYDYVNIEAWLRDGNERSERFNKEAHHSLPAHQE